MLATETTAPPGSLSRSERQNKLVKALGLNLPLHCLLWNDEETTPYECDGLTAYRQRPLVVALPENEAQVQDVLRICHAMQVPVVARGAGTGLSGGALPHALGVTLSLAKFNKILKIDPVSRTAVVQCGVRNLAISEAAAPHGMHHRRQCGRKFGWCALPEIRADHAQHREGARLHHGRRAALLGFGRARNTRL